MMILPFYLRLMFAAMLLIVPHLAGAANISAKEVEIEGKTEKWILIKGLIEPDDGIKFLDTFRQNENATTVWLDSRGGQFVEGLAIAKVVKVLKLNTYVHAQRSCDSICSIIFLSGKNKYLTSTSRIGIHSAHNKNTMKPDINANRVISWYLGSLGYAEDLANLWANTKPSELVDINSEKYANLQLGLRIVEPVFTPFWDSWFSPSD